MTGLIVLFVYVAIFLLCLFCVGWISRQFFEKSDFTSLKTVTFGDESAVRANRVASVLSVLAIFALWVAFTNSTLPLPKAKGPFDGTVTFDYTSTLENGETDDATVTVLVHKEDLQLTKGEDGKPLPLPGKPEVEPGDGFAKNDSLIVPRYGSKVINVFGNDEFKKRDGARVTHYNGQPISPGESIELAEGTLALTPKGGVFFRTGYRVSNGQTLFTGTGGHNKPVP